jgi:hypothetical protein
MTPHRKLFTTYLSLDNGEKIGSVYGHSHASIGVGNVDMRLVMHQLFYITFAIYLALILTSCRRQNSRMMAS